MTLRTRLHRWMRYRESLRELNRCSDRELCDLGLSRNDLRRVAYESAFA